MARFLRGEPKPADHNARWHERVRGYVASGRRIGRVRIVRRPLTDYQRYQFAWGIPGNVGPGEDIRVLDVTDDDHGLPLTGQDWWMFDGSRVVHLNFRRGHDSSFVKLGAAASNAVCSRQGSVQCVNQRLRTLVFKPTDDVVHHVAEGFSRTWRRQGAG